MNQIVVRRARCRIIAQIRAGLAVALSYPPLPAPGGTPTPVLAPPIASTALLLAPALAPAGAGSIALGLLGPGAAALPPTLTPAVGSGLAPPAIASGSAALAPTLSALPPPSLPALRGMTFSSQSRPIDPIINLGPAPVTGDVVVFEWADNYALTGSQLIEVALTDANQNAGEALTTALATIPAGVIYATAWYRHAGAVSYKLPVIAHGDTTPAVVTASASLSVAERGPLGLTVMSDKIGVLRLAGADAGGLEIAGTQPGTSWTVRLPGNADLDYEAKAGYAFNSIVRNLSGVDSAPATTAVTVTDVDEIIDTPDFGNQTGVPLSSQRTSTEVTFSGLAPGVTVPLTWNREFSVNQGATWLPANSVVQIGNTSKCRVRMTSAAGYSAATNAVGSAGSVALSWQVVTLADPSGIIPAFQNWDVQQNQLGARNHSVNLKAGANRLIVAAVNKPLLSWTISDGLMLTRVDRIFNAGYELSVFEVTAPADLTVTIGLTVDSSLIVSTGVLAVSTPNATAAPTEVDKADITYYSDSVPIGDGTTMPANGIGLAAALAFDATPLTWANGVFAKATVVGGWSVTVAYFTTSITPTFTFSGTTGAAGIAAAWAKT